jgi:hypothetical protein
MSSHTIPCLINPPEHINAHQSLLHQDPNFLGKYAGAFKLAAYAAGGPFAQLDQANNQKFTSYVGGIEVDVTISYESGPFVSPSPVPMEVSQNLFWPPTVTIHLRPSRLVLCNHSAHCRGLYRPSEAWSWGP